MGKQAKKATKRKKQEQKIKKKKHAKKIGLAKYIQSDYKPKNRQTSKGTEKNNDDDETSRTNLKKHMSSIKSDQRNLSLVDRCKLQMSSSLLRLMDEALYTSDTNSHSLDKDKFLAYHEAYASVCEKWPTKPIDYIVKFIKKRLLTPKKPIHKYKFADIGCGREPLLKMKLPSKAKVVSFDLVSTHKDVIEANMEKLPVEDETINCAVYSLSLMAKNLGNIILESKRILKTGGSILIVEVTSRFEGHEKRFASKLEKLGLKQKSVSVLKPNGYFTFFHFSKTDSKMDYSESCLNIELKPCVYKAR